LESARSLLGVDRPVSDLDFLLDINDAFHAEDEAGLRQRVFECLARRGVEGRRVVDQRELAVLPIPEREVPVGLRPGKARANPDGRRRAVVTHQE
jgi:hypothetical protein